MSQITSVNQECVCFKFPVKHINQVRRETHKKPQSIFNWHPFLKEFSGTQECTL